MRPSPSLLPTGQLVKIGFSFIRIPKRLPCLIDQKTGQITPLDVQQNLPYLEANGVSSIIVDQDKIKELTCVKIEDCTFTLELDKKQWCNTHGKSSK